MLDTYVVAKAYLDSKGVNYKSSDEDQTLFFGINGKECSYRVMISFVEAAEQFEISIQMAYGSLSVNKENVVKAILIANEINNNTRWIKLTVDTDDGCFYLYNDEIVTVDSCADDMWGCVCRMISIGDTLFGEIVKNLYQ